MLILTRRIGETIMINDDIHLTILGVNNNQIRLGFDAPPDVVIHRQEVYQKIKEQTLLLKRPGNWKEAPEVLTH